MDTLAIIIIILLVPISIFVGWYGYAVISAIRLKNQIDKYYKEREQGRNRTHIKGCKLTDRNDPFFNNPNVQKAWDEDTKRAFES